MATDLKAVTTGLMPPSLHKQQQTTVSMVSI